MVVKKFSGSVSSGERNGWQVTNNTFLPKPRHTQKELLLACVKKKGMLRHHERVLRNRDRSKQTVDSGIEEAEHYLNDDGHHHNYDDAGGEKLDTKLGWRRRKRSCVRTVLCGIFVLVFWIGCMYVAPVMRMCRKSSQYSFRTVEESTFVAERVPLTISGFGTFLIGLN